MKTYKQRYQQAMGEKSKLHDEFMKIRQENWERKQALEELQLYDPVEYKLMQNKVEIAIKYLYYMYKLYSKNHHAAVVAEEALLEMNVMDSLGRLK